MCQASNQLPGPSPLVPGNSIVRPGNYTAAPRNSSSSQALCAEAQVAGPLMEGHRIIGVVLSGKSGEQIPIRASKGVVLATGGFGRSESPARIVTHLLRNNLSSSKHWIRTRLRSGSYCVNVVRTSIVHNPCWKQLASACQVRARTATG